MTHTCLVSESLLQAELEREKMTSDSCRLLQEQFIYLFQHWKELHPLLLYWRADFQMSTLSMCALKAMAIFYVCGTPVSSSSFLFSRTVFMCMISFSFPRHRTRELVTICYFLSSFSFDSLGLFKVPYPGSALNMEKVFSAYVFFSTLFLCCLCSHWGILCTLMNASINFQCQSWNPYGLIIFGTISVLKHMFSEHSSFQLQCLCEFSSFFWLSHLRNVGHRNRWCLLKAAGFCLRGLVSIAKWYLSSRSMFWT